MNVYPENVTTVLRAIPGVLDAVTFGMPDEAWGERVVSCIMPVPGHALSVEGIAAEFLERGRARSCRSRSTSSTSCRAAPPARSSSAKSRT
jgi:acyl-CoA synthetase (AMP-forming)/AMP-acid ligase II